MSLPHAFVACLGLAGAVLAQSLVPAGTINGAIAAQPVVVLAHDDPAVLQSVTAIRDRFFRGAEILTGAAAAAADLRGRSALVYATPEQPWYAAHKAALPFTLDGGAATVAGRTFTGAHLRVIAALRNPADPAQRVLLYAAAHAADLVGINKVFHGPTEWVVADGDTVLASGAFPAGSLPVAEQQQDLDTLLATIAAVHPAAAEGLPAAVQEAAAAARAALAPDLDRARFALLCGRVLLALHDAHSAVELPRSGATVALPFVWLETGPVVAADAGELRRGDRIVRFAGREPDAVLAALAELVPAENPHWLRQRASQLLTDLGVLRALGLLPAAPLPLTIARGRESARDVAVPAGPLPAAPAREPWVRFAIDADHSLGVFTLDRCVVDATYRDTLDEFFTAVHAQRIGKVAVDLRANSGGNSAVVDEFLRYVDVADYGSFGGDVRWSAAALQQRHEPGQPRFARSPPARRRNVRRSDPPPFQGQLFVLVGPATFSSGNWFAVVVHDNKLGTLVGEPTGNAPSSYGDILRFSLPHAAIDYTLSFKRWVRPDPAQDPAPCLEPDVLVPRTAATIRSGSDPVLDWLRAR